MARSGGNYVTVATALCATRAVARLPEGAEWWIRTDLATARAREKLADGNPDYAFALIGELLAVPAPDEWDPNWPPHKVAWALLPRDPHVGQTFVVGNGEGGRATVEVIEQDGRLQAVITSAQHSLDDLWDEAVADAQRLLAGA